MERFGIFNQVKASGDSCVANKSIGLKFHNNMSFSQVSSFTLEKIGKV